MVIGVDGGEYIDAVGSNGNGHGQGMKSQSMQVVVFSPPAIDFAVSMRSVEEDGVVYISNMAPHLVVTSSLWVDAQ